MKTSAIICEYNPLHNGHVYHIQKTRENGATHIVAVLSSNFVQRGDVALLDKFDRAKLALRAGADLVLELPTVFSMSSAELYATGAISLLRGLGMIDELSFGSSNGDLECLELLTEASVSTTKVYQERILDLMRQGESYPAAMWEIVRQRYGNRVAGMMHDPNNLLAIEYLKAMQKLDVDFKPFTIQRQCVSHDSMTASDMFASASFIRKSVGDGDHSYLDYVPACTAKLLSQRITEGRTAHIQNLERIALYKMRMMTEEELLQLPDVGKNLQNRIYAARSADSWEELLASIKTKCYTMARIRRILLSALIGMTKEDQRHYPPYARVLAFNERGREILGRAKNKSSIEIGTSLSKLAETGKTAANFVRLEENASNVYGLAQGMISSAQQDYRAKIVMEMSK